MLFEAVRIILFVILEVHSKDDTEGESDLNVKGDTINGNNEDELERSTSASKRRRKCTKSDEEQQKTIKGKKGKQLKKSCKGCSNQLLINIIVLKLSISVLKRMVLQLYDCSS